MNYDQWLYNLSSIAELLIFSYIFYFTVKDKGMKRIILIIFIISVLALLIDFILVKGTITIWWSYGFGFVGLGLSAMGIVFLIEMARSERVINQTRILLYWVVLGLLFFNLCNLPVTVLTNDLLDIGNVNNILVIQSIAGIAMYFCYVIGFIWSRKDYNY